MRIEYERASPRHEAPPDLAALLPAISARAHALCIIRPIGMATRSVPSGGLPGVCLKALSVIFVELGLRFPRPVERGGAASNNSQHERDRKRYLHLCCVTGRGVGLPQKVSSHIGRGVPRGSPAAPSGAESATTSPIRRMGTSWRMAGGSLADLNYCWFALMSWSSKATRSRDLPTGVARPES